jgi:inorganic phosphate transporter, PiT family
MLPRRTALAPAGASADDLVLDAPSLARPELDGGFGPRAAVAFFSVLGLAMFFVAYSIYNDVHESGTRTTAVLPFVLLGVALLVALGFEFVNGFHDTANAVATVIYTHSMPPYLAVLWSGAFNFLGVLWSSGAVAYGIIALLPVELILQAGSHTGFAMVFALLLGAIIWNLGTWYLGLPASSSHTLIGSIIGVGLMNQLMAPSGAGASGVDWGQAAKIGYSLLLSPMIGFTAAALLLLVLKQVARNPQLYAEPKRDAAPPMWIRGILVLTCTSVSFAHGSNDGQKGMGLIMLILIGVVPTAYALNRAMPDSAIQPFLEMSNRTALVLDYYSEPATVTDARAEIGAYLRAKTVTPAVVPAIATVVRGIESQVALYGSLRRLPADTVQNVRNDMYLVDEALRRIDRTAAVPFAAKDAAVLLEYRGSLDRATRFIPTWVKIAVAIALGLGTMVGWKRIVITVGEKIGKSHLTYAQGASAELVAATTIAAADIYGLPVSTTHVLSSGIAGTMAANRSGLQGNTLRALLAAWVLTLPMAIALSGSLFWLFVRMF